MATKEKACLNCRTIYLGEKCPKCGENKGSEVFKGRVHVFDYEKSEIADNMKLNSNGEFAVKSK